MTDAAKMHAAESGTTSSVADDVRHAMDKLKSEREGEIGIEEAILCGRPAIPALRRLLFEHEPSGLYHARRRAVEALAALHAYDVLMDFLRMHHDATDPVELVGDEAVINAAALALAKVREEHVFQLLLLLTRRRPLMGLTSAVGSFQRRESIPCLIEALGADDCRFAAEAALRRFGRFAESALLATVVCRQPSAVRESESSLRRRRSAIALLVDMPVSADRWSALRQLLTDKDPKIALAACNIGLAIAPIEDRKEAARRLIELLSEADWMTTEEIKRCLVSHFDQAADAIAQVIEAGGIGQQRSTPAADRVLHALLEVRALAEVAGGSKAGYG